MKKDYGCKHWKTEHFLSRTSSVIPKYTEVCLSPHSIARVREIQTGKNKKDLYNALGYSWHLSITNLLITYLRIPEMMSITQLPPSKAGRLRPVQTHKPGNQTLVHALRILELVESPNARVWVCSTRIGLSYIAIVPRKASFKITCRGARGLCSGK